MLLVLGIMALIVVVMVGYLLLMLLCIPAYCLQLLGTKYLGFVEWLHWKFQEEDMDG